MKNKTLVNKVLILIAIILVISMIKVRWLNGDGKRWRTIVETDGKGYYAYLPAIFIYHDLQYNFIIDAETSIYGAGGAQRRLLVNGEPGNKYFVGEAVLLTPFFLVAWFISSVTGNGSSGYNMIFFGSVAIAAIFYLLAGLIYLNKLFRLYNVQEKWIAFILLLLVFATNIFWYVIFEPSMSHIYSFTAISAFLFYMKSYQLQQKTYQLVFAAAALGIIVLLRPVNAMIVIGLPFLAGSFREFLILIGNIFRNIKGLVLSIIVFTSLVFIQLFIYYLTTGNFLHWPYAGESFDFLHPYFWDGLISYRKGLFIYTPVMFIALLFIIPYFKKDRFAAVSYLISFIVIIWVITSWYCWSYGGAFSLRPVLEFYPLLVIPMAVGLNAIKKKYQTALVAFIFFPLTALCLLQTYQYNEHILSYDEMNKQKYWKVFMKTNTRLKLVANPPVVVTISRDSLTLKKVIKFDFDNDTLPYCTSDYYSGGHCIRLDKNVEYSPSYAADKEELEKEEISYVEIKLMAKKANDDNTASLVVSFEDNNGQIFEYYSYPVGMLLENNSWEQMSYSIRFPQMSAKDKIKVYVWNKSEMPLYVDDIKIELYSVKGIHEL